MLWQTDLQEAQYYLITVHNLEISSVLVFFTARYTVAILFLSYVVKKKVKMSLPFQL